MMTHTITTRVTLDPTERPGVIQNVHENLRWALANPRQCVHLKFVHADSIVGVILVKNFWNLCSLFVAPNFHGQGIGRSLVSTAIERCACDNQRPYIKVIAAPNAIGFYTTMGFNMLDDATQTSVGTPMTYAMST